MRLFHGCVGAQNQTNYSVGPVSFFFSKEKHVFNCAGYNDINSIYKSDKRYRHSVNHIACLKEITLFVKNNRIVFSLSSQYKQSIEKHSEAVKQNRKIVGQFIRAVCLLGSRGHDENGASIIIKNYIEVLNMLARYNSDLHNHL
jgi:hypothetical protein